MVSDLVQASRGSSRIPPPAGNARLFAACTLCEITDAVISGSLEDGLSKS
jgi:hypothetical protein